MGYAKSGFRLLSLFAFLSLSLFLEQMNSAILGCSMVSPEDHELTVIAVGDILLSRHVGKTIDLSQDPNLPFENTRPWLSEADIAFGNLESPIVSGDIPIRRGVVFKCLTRYVPGLVYAGFDVLSTANNHAFDQGDRGVDFTVNYLQSHSILAVGTRKKEDQASFGRVIERKGVKVGFLAYSYAAYNDGGAKENSQVATWHDPEKVKEEIGQLRDNSDVVFVSLHAGQEYRRKPERRKIEFARAAIEAGADAVIGHHPHWIQPVEIYRGRPIFYSLGNFVFDQGHSQETSQGLMVEFRIKRKQIRSSRLLPVAIERYCCPRLADSQLKESILEKTGLDSDEIFFSDERHEAGK